MGWQSSLLGGNVVSSYQHIDNLRNDLTAGKFWDSDGSDYTRVRHDGSNGYLESSIGNLNLSPASGSEVRVNGVSSHYVSIKHNGTDGMLSIDSGSIRIYAPDGGYAFSRTAGGSMGLVHDGTNGTFGSNNGKLILYCGGDNRRVQIGTGVLAGVALRIQDWYSGIWMRAYIYNGAWIIEADT